MIEELISNNILGDHWLLGLAQAVEGKLKVSMIHLWMCLILVTHN